MGIGSTAHAVEFMRGDAVIVTGSFTGDAADLQELEEVKKAVSLPVLLGSGVNADNLSDYVAWADGFIVGSSFKKDGEWQQEPDPARIRTFLKRLRQLAGRRP